jgi:hypothetical protein
MAVETAVVRIELGLDGGQIVQLVSSRDEWDRMRGDLEGTSGGWVTVKDEAETEYHVSSDKVAYVRVLAHDRRIGFNEL